eukprot:CAMPEP_0197540350 /NCGR_PEP_ID=MMETSP1318-20131121/65514_1 /TAXON_ID=552666 /ORGANISM="Partenskyella glossopodia, Strain RCC365" /LENGTH=437 /DNA_ID=CAMNT_0043099305 /DNA_START=158 /DNA_END=1471 /DNA_ORIENTATION=-
MTRGQSCLRGVYKLPAMRTGGFDSLKSFSSSRSFQPLRLTRSPGMIVSKSSTIPEAPTGAWKAPDPREAKKLENIEINSVLKGVVKAVKPFGAFVDIGFEKDGLLPTRELRKVVKDISNAENDLFGREVEVKVAEVDLVGRKFRLSSVIAEPKIMVDHLKEGEEVEGKVVSMAKFGVFVDIGAGKHGLLHQTWLGSEAYADGVVPGEMVKVKILKLDVEKNKITLGAPGRPGDPDKDNTKSRAAPLQEQDFSKYQNLINNRQFKAKVVAMMKFGALMQLEDGTRGLLPTRFAYADRIQHVSEVMDVGDIFDVYILGIDDRGMSFSRRPITGRQQSDNRRGGAMQKKTKTTVSAGGMSFNIGKDFIKNDETKQAPRNQAAAAPVASINAEGSEESGEVEVEEREFGGVTYLVDPSTNEVYTEDGEVVGEWEGEQPVFY